MEITYQSNLASLTGRIEAVCAHNGALFVLEQGHDGCVGCCVATETSCAADICDWHAVYVPMSKLFAWRRHE
jgi:hypothetical protein